jgi:Zn-dependent M28 family amino/carboxypeptidase
VASEGNAKAAEYIAWVLEHEGWTVEVQEYAYGGERLQNVIGSKGQGPILVLGTHFDTRPLADMDPADRSNPVIGANDGGSGVGVLLELARVLKASTFDQTQVRLAFVDGQNRGEIDGWPWSVGARHMANDWIASVQPRPEYALFVDMVGDQDQVFYYEWSSTLWLLEKAWAVAQDLGYAAHFRPEYRYRTLNDHVPFLDQGIPAAVIVDLDYAYWRTSQDTADKVSVDSLQRMGNVLEMLVEQQPFGTRVD